ncbi:hypothetical protein [Halochromatium roseum]|uniref:hypothetical protein n=1 Tax=Halochromatium roseum TaxID=391920 RepID=UPI00191183BD|nr:hypothetical protein [Halochromatium roseum]
MRPFGDQGSRPLRPPRIRVDQNHSLGLGPLPPAVHGTGTMADADMKQSLRRIELTQKVKP